MVCKIISKKYHNVIYISGNPYINSKTEVGGFNAQKHFCKVIDVWNFGWSKERGTVLPRKINETTLRFFQKFPEKRFIVHYLQPHAPYISVKFRTKGFPTPNTKCKHVLAGYQGYHGNKSVERFTNALGYLLAKLGLVHHPWKLREILKLPPASPKDAVRRMYGVTGLREAYKENLRIVLQYAAELCNELLNCKPSRSIVITSDHGEALGENGIYSHPYGSKNPVLLKVPWFKVTKVKKLVSF